MGRAGRRLGSVPWLSDYARRCSTMARNAHGLRSFVALSLLDSFRSSDPLMRRRL
jgi:hypothetical protein